MRPYKIREDRVGTHEYECYECSKKFQDKDIIYELDMYEDYFRFCSTECIMKWLESDIEKRQVEVYPMTDEQRTYNEISDAIKGIKPNTRIIFSDEFNIEYYKIDGLKEHYLLLQKYYKPISFDMQHDVINYIYNKLK